MKKPSIKHTPVTSTEPSSSVVQSPPQTTVKNDSRYILSTSFQGWGESRETRGDHQNAPWCSPVDYDKYAPFMSENYGQRLADFDEAAKVITNSSHPLYRLEVGPSEQRVWKRTPLSKYFADLNGFMGLIMAGCPQTEHIKLFFKHMYSLELQNVYFTSPSGSTSFPTGQNVSADMGDESRGLFKIQAEVGNELAKAMQQEGKTQAFKDRVAATEETAFEVVLIRESQMIRDLQETRREISKLRNEFLKTKCGIYPGEPAHSEAEVAATRQLIVQLQLNRFAIARLQNAKKTIDRQLVIARASHGQLLGQLCDPE